MGAVAFSVALAVTDVPVTLRADVRTVAAFTVRRTAVIITDSYICELLDTRINKAPLWLL
jgi:hypothetical protein